MALRVASEFRSLQMSFTRLGWLLPSLIAGISSAHLCAAIGRGETCSSLAAAVIERERAANTFEVPPGMFECGCRGPFSSLQALAQLLFI